LEFNLLKVHIDFETRSACNLKEAGADVYAAHLTTDVLCMGYAIGEEKVKLWKLGEPFPDELRDAIKNGASVYAHNAHFEMLIWHHVCVKKYGWPPLDINKVFCTMALSYSMAMPGSLEKAAPAFGLKHEKDMFGNRIMLQVSQPRSVDLKGNIVWWDCAKKLNEVYKYCKNDVEVERALHKRLINHGVSEREVWLLDYKINRRGIKLDMESVRCAIKLVVDEKNRLDARMRAVTDNGVATCNATAQLKSWLKFKGIEVEGVTKEDVLGCLDRNDLPVECRTALLIRQEAGKSSTSKLSSMASRAGSDSRIRGTTQFCGANTGRWAGRGVQVHNFPRPKTKQKDIEKIFEILPKKDATEEIDLFYGSPLSVLSDCLRGFLVAEEGMELVGADLNAIEARVLAWLAGEKKVLDIFNGHGKLYEQTAADIFSFILRKKLTIQDVTEDQRQIGKVADLALGYQGASGAFKSMSKNYGINLPEEQVSFIVKAWRTVHPNTVFLWKELEEAAMYAVLNPNQEFKAGKGKISFKKVGSFLWCKLPSSRVLCYPYPEIQTIDLPWGGQKEGLTYMTEELQKWKRVKTYGGSLAENVTQAVSRDILADAMKRVEKAGFPIVLHVHDEIVSEVNKNSVSIKDYESIMAQTPDWAKDLPIKAKGWSGFRYRK
jgi:DNA polymerase